jgi:hypothetical protein
MMHKDHSPSRAVCFARRWLFDPAGDMPHRLVADSDILARYVQKQGCPLACSAERGRLSQESLLWTVSHPQKNFKDHAKSLQRREKPSGRPSVT